MVLWHAARCSQGRVIKWSDERRVVLQGDSQSALQGESQSATWELQRYPHLDGLVMINAWFSFLEATQNLTNLFTSGLEYTTHNETGDYK